MKLAIQLYTLRDIIRDEETLADALLHLRQMGYEGVEFAGLYDIPAPRVRQIVEQAGMHALSCHVSLDAMEQELDGVLEDAKVLGLDTVAMAWSAADSPEAVARAVRVLQAAQSAAEPHGVRILYHNHSHELRPRGRLRGAAAGAYHAGCAAGGGSVLGVLRGAGPCALFAREQQPHRAFAYQGRKKIEALALCVGRRRGRYPGDLPCRSRLRQGMADR